MISDVVALAMALRRAAHRAAAADRTAHVRLRPHRGARRRSQRRAAARRRGRHRRRSDAPARIDAGHRCRRGVIVIGGLGLLVNVGSAWIVGRHAHGNLNMRGALWHLVADALGSVAVIVAGDRRRAVRRRRGSTRSSSYLIAVLDHRRLRGGCSATRRACCSKRCPPTSTSTRCARRSPASPVSKPCITCTCGRSGASRPALSAHVVLDGPLSLHDAQVRAAELKHMLAERFGIEHATLEVECHACVDDERTSICPPKVVSAEGFGHHH